MRRDLADRLPDELQESAAGFDDSSADFQLVYQTGNRQPRRTVAGMPKLRDLHPVDIDYATNGPNGNTLTQQIAAPAGNLFRCLEDGSAWKEWLGLDVEWTSPQPFDVGTTRTVKSNGQTIDERFLAWENGSRMNFRFERTTLPVSAFAEDYAITATSPTTCELAWSYAFEWAGPLPALTAPLFRRVFAANCKRSLKKLAELMATSGSRFDVAN